MKTYTGHRNERKVLWKVFNHEFLNKNLYEQGHPFHPYCLFESILSWVHFLPLNQVFYRHNIYASWVVEQQGREGRSRGVEVSVFFLFWPTLSSSERAIGVGSPRHFVQGFLLGSPSKIPAVHRAMTRAVTSPMFCKHRGNIPGLPQMASLTSRFGLLVGLFGHVGCPIRDSSVRWQVLHHQATPLASQCTFKGRTEAGTKDTWIVTDHVVAPWNTVLWNSEKAETQEDMKRL